jgi:hypothetical protein
VAELVTIDGQTYRRRDPLGVLGLSFITVGIYWLYWYYMYSQEHLNKVWDAAARRQLPPTVPGSMPPPPA